MTQGKEKGVDPLLRKNKSKKSLSSIVSQSMILPLLYRFAVFFMNGMRNSMIGRFFCGYEKEQAHLSHVGTKEKQAADPSYRSAASRFVRTSRFRIAAQFDKSAISGLFQKLGIILANLPMSTYGMAVLFFSFFSAITIIIRFFLTYETGQTLDPISITVTAAALFIGIGCVGSSKRLFDAILQSRLGSFLFFKAAGARETEFRAVTEAGMTSSVHSTAMIASIIGAVLGLLSAGMPPLLFPIAILGIPILLLIYKTPEFGVVFVLFALPFFPTMLLVALMGYLLFCFLLKCLRGKRILRFEWMDLSVALFALVYLLSGIVSASPSDTVKPMLVLGIFLTGYFLVVNLIRSSEWLTRALIAVVSSSVLVSLYGIFENFFGKTEDKWQDEEMFQDISGRVVSTFENPNVLAEYLILCIPIAIAGFLVSKKPSHKLAYLFATAAGGACLVFTWSRGAWLGFLIAMLIFFVMYSKKAVVAMFFGVFALPFVPFVLPQSILNRFLSIGNLGDSSTSYRVHIWEGTCNMLSEHGLGGIGIGVDVFQKIYPRYALSGIESAPHSHNLFLQIAVECGVLGLILFFVCLFTYAKHTFSHITLPYTKKSRTTVCAIFAATLAILAQGLTDHIWYNYRVFLFFWLCIGLCVASCRVMREEERSRILSRS